MLTNVTAKIISAVTGLDKTNASALVRIMVAKGQAKESGARKNLSQHGEEYLVVRGRPSVTFDVDASALVAYVGEAKATEIADRAAAEHAEYTKLLAHAEINAKNKRDAVAKQNKIKGLEAQLAAIRGETGEAF